MPSLFASLAAVAGGTVDAVFSEGFVLYPRSHAPLPGQGGVADVNSRTRPSTVRAALPFVGTFVAAGALAHAHNRTRADSTTHAIAAETPMIDIGVGALPLLPKVGDRIRRDDTGEMFTVAHVLSADFGRAWIHLTDARARPETPR